MRDFARVLSLMIGSSIVVGAVVVVLGAVTAPPHVLALQDLTVKSDGTVRYARTVTTHDDQPALIAWGATLWDPEGERICAGGGVFPYPVGGKVLNWTADQFFAGEDADNPNEACRTPIPIGSTYRVVWTPQDGNYSVTHAIGEVTE
mgnify:CR=1 FL=1